MGIIWMILLVILAGIFLSLLGLKIFLMWRLGVCKSTADLSGKTVIVTGANTGIGYYTALDLARRNARVILACRNQARGQAAVDKIKAATNNKDVCVKIVDLSLMKSVREFADDIVKNEDRIDVLVNNAGMADKIKQCAPSRIVNVSSMAHKWATLDFDNLDSEKKYDPGNIYYKSKLGNVLFTRELAKRLEGTGVDVYCVHPGPVHTDLYRHLPYILDLIYRSMIRFSFKTAEEGAQTSIYCAVSEEVKGQSGKYYQDCHEVEGDSSEMSKDMGLAKKLWEVSERMTGLVGEKTD